MNPAFCLVNQLVAFINTKAHGNDVAYDQANAKLPDVFKGCFYIFEMCKHEFDLNW